MMPLYTQNTGLYTWSYIYDYITDKNFKSNFKLKFKALWQIWCKAGRPSWGPYRRGGSVQTGQLPSSQQSWTHMGCSSPAGQTCAVPAPHKPYIVLSYFLYYILHSIITLSTPQIGFDNHSLFELSCFESVKSLKSIQYLTSNKVYSLQNWQKLSQIVLVMKSHPLNMWYTHHWFAMYVYLHGTYLCGV